MSTSVTHNTLYNILGAVLPLLVALVTVPLYLHRIGEARYGILALVWLLLGYFGVFDLGLSRATANQVARLHNAASREREGVFWTALWLNLGFGTIGGLVLYAVAAPLLAHVFKMPAALRPEVFAALPWMAAAVPLATVTGVLTGTLEGRERFLTVNALQVLGTVLFQGVPLVVAYTRGPDLAWLIPAAIVARAASMAPLLVTALRVVPVNRLRLPERRWIPVLLTYGGWVTVTDLIVLFMETSDRFFIGAILGASYVAYYSVSSNLASAARIPSGAMSRTLFPKLSMYNALQASALSVKAARALGVLITPMLVLGIFIIEPFLRAWVGLDFALRAAPIGRMLLLGVWINSIALIPFYYLQAQGRPDVAAKFNMLELAPFIGALWVSMHELGLLGAALAWNLRIIAEAIMLFWVSRLGLAIIHTLWPGWLFVSAAWLVASLWAPDPALLVSSGVLLVTGSVIWGLKVEPLLPRLLLGFLGRIRAEVNR